MADETKMILTWGDQEVEFALWSDRKTWVFVLGAGTPSQTRLALIEMDDLERWRGKWRHVYATAESPQGVLMALRKQMSDLSGVIESNLG